MRQVRTRDGHADVNTWIVLPAFNEAENLPPLLEAIAETVAAAHFRCTAVVVNDGSTDCTLAAAKIYEGKLPLRIVSHEQNMGLGRTIETGIRTTLCAATDDDIIITMDADNTHSPALIPRMLSEVARGADIVIASRYAPGGMEDGVPLMRKVLSHGAGKLMSLRFPMPGVRDYTSGYRAYRVKVLRAGANRYGDRLVETRGFTVMAELLIKLAPFCSHIAEVPLHLRYDLKRGESKIRVLGTTAGYVRLLCSRLGRAA